MVYVAAFSQSKRKKNKDSGYHQILETKNIKEIEKFLAVAHPEDPRVFILKPRLIALKNSAWLKGKSDGAAMQARPIVAEIPKKLTKNPRSNESEEFLKLMTETSTAHKEKTVKLLNTLFDQDIAKKEAILLIQNNSDCNRF